MDIKERIQKIVNENRKPVQELCPDLIIYWHGNNKDGYWERFYEPMTGKISSSNPRPGRYKYGVNERACCSYGYDGLYIKNHDGILELAHVLMDKGNRGYEGEIREWKFDGGYYSEHIFVDIETLLPYNRDGERIHASEDGRYYNKAVPKFFNTYGNRMFNVKAIAEFNSWSGNATFRSWRGMELLPEWPTGCGEAYKKIKARPENKKNKTFLEIDLPEKKYTDNMIEFSIINENYCIFRCFRVNKTWDCINRKYVNTECFANESVRVFIDAKGKPSVCIREHGKWKVTTASFSSSFYFYDNNIDSVGFEDIYNWKPIMWVKELIDESGDASAKRKVDMIIDILRHPVVEKLYKSGYKMLAKKIQGDYINSSARERFAMNKVNEKEKSLYKMLGVNKYLLQLAEDNEIKHANNWRAHTGDIIYSIKDYCGSEDVSYLSKESCEAYFKLFEKNNGYNWRHEFGMGSYRWRYGHSEFTYDGVDESSKRIIERLCKLEAKDSGAIEAYRDARTTYSRLTTKPEISWDFRNVEDIMQIHDNLHALYNAQQERYHLDREAKAREEAEQYRKRFEKLQEERIEKYECEGDKYQIVVPKDLVELTREGTELRHCVGGYLQRHANGDTNIMFLRNKENPTIPFYTIEVKDNYVVQIHGKCNQWLGNNPEAISFVWKWIQDRGFECEKYKLLDKASGYCKSGKEVSESYLVA